MPQEDFDRAWEAAQRGCAAQGSSWFGEETKAWAATLRQRERLWSPGARGRCLTQRRGERQEGWDRSGPGHRKLGLLRDWPHLNLVCRVAPPR